MKATSSEGDQTKSEYTEDSDDGSDLPEEVKLLSSTPKRIYEFGKKTLTTIFLTTDELPDIAFEQAPEVLSIETIYLFGVFRRITFLAFFLYLVIVSYQTLVYKREFAALYPGAGSCKTVSKGYTIPTISADYYGSWEGSLAFQANYAMYIFSFFNFAGNTVEYTKFMTSIQTALKSVGRVASGQDLAQNLVYWGSWVHNEQTFDESGRTNEQSLTMNGDPRFIMFNDYTQSTVANMDADCPFAYSTSAYSLPGGLLQMGFDVTTLLKNTSECYLIVNPPLLGYDPSMDGNMLTITIDVYTLFSAMVVTNAVNGPNSLNKYVTINLYAEFEFRGVIYQVKRKFDGLYPTMTPMYCLGPKGSNSSEWNCLLKIGNSFGIPFLVHSGATSSFPQKCDCSTNIGRSPACNQFNLLSGVIMHDYSKNYSGTASFQDHIKPFLPALEVFYVPPVQSASTANQLAYYPAWAAMFGQGSPQFDDPLWRQNAYQFSYTDTFGYASLIVFQSFTARDWTISKNKYQLRQGSCADSFSTPSFQNLIHKPWASLYQPYWRCTASAARALLTSVGTSSGNARLLVPAFVMICMFGCMALVAYYNTDEYIKRIKQRDFGVVKSADDFDGINMAVIANPMRERASHDHDHGNGNDDEVDEHGRSESDAFMPPTFASLLTNVNSDSSSRSKLAAGSSSVSHNFSEFHKRRLRELQRDEMTMHLDPKDVTELILAEWKSMSDDQKAASD